MGAVRAKRGTIGLLAAFVLALAVLFPGTSTAAIPDVFDENVVCAAQPSNGNVRICSGPTTTWDGQTKIDVNVILPPEPVSGADGPYPAIGVFHGWGGSKLGLEARTQGWAEDGYLVFSMSARGWGESCGAADPDRILFSTKCAAGYNHLMDTRYEVRDAQHLFGVLADEGLIQPDRIGSTGVSYGGGLSMALAALRDRVMLPDGSLVPWTSPEGTPMEVAAAVPQWPWSDLAYSLMPNGTTLDYVADAPYRGPDGTAPIGVMKASYVTALYSLGQASSNYALPATDPDADLVTWFALVSAGEPYDSNPLAQDIVDEITTHHSSYYIDHSRPPAPLLIQSGWNDDLFPVNEAVRFYNRTRTEHTGHPISLMLTDDGHMRSQSKPADLAAFATRRDAWFDHYLKGVGAPPQSSVEALTTSCGKPSEGPYSAPTWRDLAPGEIRLAGPASQTIAPAAGDPSIGATFDPVGGGGACATVSGADQVGAATYRLGPAPDPGFTLAGSPTVIADLDATGTDSSLAARLLDVSPDGTQTLVSRGLLRPGTGGTRRVFQLQPQAYRFAPGHVAKLELLPSDAPYSRPSNTQGPIAVSNLELRLPVLEAPGSLGGIVQPPAPKVVPPGYELVSDHATASPVGASAAPSPPRRPGRIRLARGRVVANARAALVRARCEGEDRCVGKMTVKARGRAVARGRYSLHPGPTRKVRLVLTKAGRKLVQARAQRSRRSFRARVRVTSGDPSLLVRKRAVHLKRSLLSPRS